MSKDKDAIKKPPSYRLGRITKQEIAFIEANHHKLTPAQIAHTINRKEEMVMDWIVKNVPAEVIEAAAAKSVVSDSLRQSQAWQQLKHKFDFSELLYFEEKYIELMDQFRDEATATERTQLMLSIEFEILMNRNMKARRRALEDIDRIEKAMQSIVAKVDSHDELEEKERDFLINMETQLQAAKAGEQSKTKEYVDLEGKHQALIRDLKATRDQRISRVADAKQSFLGLIKALQEEEVRERNAKQTELMRLATQEEYKRMAKPHKYLDGNEDQPILSSETLELLEESNV